MSSGLIPVPSTLERGGDFSDLATTGYGAFTGSVRGGNSPTNFPAVLSQRLAIHRYVQESILDSPVALH